MSNDVNITIFTHEIHECYITKLSGKTLNCALDEPKMYVESLHLIII